MSSLPLDVTKICRYQTRRSSRSPDTDSCTTSAAIGACRLPAIRQAQEHEKVRDQEDRSDHDDEGDDDARKELEDPPRTDFKPTFEVSPVSRSPSRAEREVTNRLEQPLNQRRPSAPEQANASSARRFICSDWTADCPLAPHHFHIISALLDARWLRITLAVATALRGQSRENSLRNDAGLDD